MFPPEFIPSNYNVMCAKGNPFDNHVGNRQFRTTIRMQDRFTNAESEDEKSKLFDSIIGTVCSKSKNDGGFVGYDPTTRRWYQAKDHIAKMKIMLPFVDMAKEKSDEAKHKDVVLPATQNLKDFPNNFVPSDWDVVVCSDGEDIYGNHAANRTLRVSISMQFEQFYTAQRQKEKLSILRSLVNTVKSDGGRFVYSEAGRWYEADNQLISKFIGTEFSSMFKIMTTDGRGSKRSFSSVMAPAPDFSPSRSGDDDLELFHFLNNTDFCDFFNDMDFSGDWMAGSAMPSGLDLSQFDLTPIDYLESNQRKKIRLV
mmetsp:Transcript_32863/g.50269  ORF Transcript_32863/g.50269 Transcript_32863/m.50269 type:complete len:312 (-) Transcript_32863:223-1158(-)|eukprot:CAMPEP_0118695760 /NCGR_PEP_ID=MMETSP0800-20121206/13402_1 /TAXON_ID=210618 ORGANISM="Striatella unipunctata, Strain CCMP2910" /NCGR_SAMPLE_ID=MMETSP0800 /ASSEMBLY_ACC=CAM_ASM_000638 /LENGTH=311 /DNA_ID=CAMNT_0006594661 /DNA_START=148 /DNA_END=1083 /DNA_ORIENTATION=-